MQYRMIMEDLISEVPKINKQIIYDIFLATRPLSLTLAIYSTTIGIVIAYHNGFLFQPGSYGIDIVKILLVTIAGLLVQTGANLINDYFECEYKYRPQSIKKYRFLGKQRTLFDIFIFLFGLACFGATGFIGLILLYLTSSEVLIVGILGIIGSYSYTGEPIVYKKRGLGTPLSFLLMGPLMVYGAYVVFSESFSLSPILLSLPVSLLIPALMLSNELRDFNRDKKLGIRTLTVRLGYLFGRNLYIALLVVSYLLVFALVIVKQLPVTSLFVFITVPLAIKSYRLVAVNQRALVPETNKLHLSFGLILIISLLI
ncbi:1,4-dihydroxy-2-naphthoate octaprenyltransferase [Paraliobacillus sp. PM-2]|uniref:prenyltransferase n=1 Tax=Paraliobacillus sp. PM-2 TaxID=1462524 RepID=UPI00061C2375|nr:prenyltransferase [Paraliobacillus sp. PM-2]CQR47903.1 1,4-dihydroxy-2-naphthoate octaprenyltransferase [Paraliobacillus sp. PM-2]